VTVDDAGRVWTGGADGALRVFDEVGAALGEVAVGASPVVALAAGGGLIAAGTVDGTLSVVEADGLAVRHAAPVAEGPLWALAFAEEGAAVLAAAGDHVVRRWDAADGRPLDGLPEVAEAGAGAAPEDAGARVFRMCAACHTLEPDDGNRAGPTLHGVFGRPIGTAEGYDYSEAFAEMDIVWTPETVARLFEIGPMAMTPGTKMPEQRIPDPRDRAALIAFLEANAH
jgi:cytochrome c